MKGRSAKAETRSALWLAAAEAPTKLVAVEVSPFVLSFMMVLGAFVLLLLSWPALPRWKSTGAGSQRSRQRCCWSWWPEELLFGVSHGSIRSLFARRKGQSILFQISTLSPAPWVQFAPSSEFFGVVPSPTQLFECGISRCRLEFPHLARIFLKLSDQLLKPRVADPELASPVATRGLLRVTACKPPEHVP
jgi:hypothetical protein